MPKKDLQGEFVIEGEKNKKEQAGPKSPTAPVTQSPVKKSPHFYSAFAMYPEGVQVQNQQANEEVILILRRHFIINIPWITTALIFSIIPFIILPFIPFIIPSLALSTLTQTLFLSLYYLIIFGYILLNFTLWYFNVGVITNERVFDIDLSGILYRQVNEAKIAAVRDVSYIQIGSIRSFLDYGDVFVQTAVKDENIEFDRVPHPAQVVKIISDFIQTVPTT